MFKCIKRHASSIEKLDTKQLLKIYFAAVATNTSSDFLELIENILCDRGVLLNEHDQREIPNDS
ncbi:hypothetical protein ASG89_22355 [Paenibacillus sp. Soil766]|nr:hypothetical protein ASG89_22355 [Paenibacillus sp. Soil766]